MEKLKKPFLIISGILKCFCSALFLLIAGIIFLMKDVLKAVMLDMGTASKEFVDEMMAIDPEEYLFLTTYTEEQVLDYMMSTINTVGWIFLVLGIFILVFGVLSFIISKNGGYLPLGKRIAFIATMLVTTMIFSLSNILTVVALCTGNGARNNTKQNKISEEEKDIPHYEIS